MNPSTRLPHDPQTHPVAHPRQAGRPGSLPRFRDGEAGRSLPAALIALALGSILLAPFLAFVSSRSLGTRAAAETFAEQYAADAGVEFAIWSLLNDPTVRSQADAAPGTPVTVAFPEPVNGVTPTVTVTGRPGGSWVAREPVSPDYAGPGGALAFPGGYAGGNYIYAMMGQGSTAFKRYNRSNVADPWTNTNWIPQLYYLFLYWDGSYGDLAYSSGDDIYTFFPGYLSDSYLIRYDAGPNTYTLLGITPDQIQQGATLIYGGTNAQGDDLLFAFRGNGRTFWRYNIESGNWQEMKKLPGFASAELGADLVYTGGDYIYALMGGNTTDFLRFDKEQGNKGKWEKMTDLPLPSGVGVGGGGSLAYHSGDYIYALQGGGSDQFWRYTISSDTWKALDPTPAGVDSGGDLVMVGPGNGYALRGGNNPEFWEFTVTPLQYDIQSQAGSSSIRARIQLDGGSPTIMFWDIE